MRHLLIAFFALIGVQQIQAQQDAISLQPIADGFNSPVDIANAGDERIFIVEQIGRIRIIGGDNTVLSTPFLDIQGRVNDSGGEQGLLGLAFHPNYPTTPYFYVNYTRNTGATRISRFSLSTDNANQADPDSELILMEMDQPFSNHNGGDLEFGPDGYLYIGTGDGGWFGDPGDRSQNPMNLLGKMLRIDVDNGDPYAIPESNPFANDDFTADEIWALGLRNPWRFSFDRETGDLWIGDVGQDAYEEIDFQPASSTGGENYGWRCYEGNEAYNLTDCQSADNYDAPIHTYNHGSTNGCSVTGGYVYRGSQQSSLIGRYIYVDFCSGVFWALTRTDETDYENVRVLNSTNNNFSAFGENNDGELFVAGLSTQTIYRVAEACPATPEIDQDGSSLSTSDSWEAYQWYRDEIAIDGATSSSWEAVESGQYQVAVSNSLGCTTVSAPLTVEVSQVVDHPLISDISIAPNPFEEQAIVSIQLMESEVVSWTVLSAQGQVMRRGEEATGTAVQFVLPGELLAAGQYWLRIHVGGQEISLPIQKR